MKNKFKIIMLDVLDIDALESYLNEKAENGWHPVKLNLYRIILKYDPENTNRYTVVLHNDSLFSDGGIDNDPTRDFLLDFNYQQAFSTSVLDVYASNTTVPFYTDQDLQLQERKKIGNKFFNQYLLLVVLNLISIFFLLPSLYQVILSNTSQMALGVLASSIFLNLNLTVKYYHLKKHGIAKTRRKWESDFPMFFELFVFSLFIMTLLMLSKSLILIIATFLGISIYFVKVLLDHLSFKKSIKTGIFYVAFYLIFSLSTYFVVATSIDFNKLPTSNVIVQESWIAKEEDFGTTRLLTVKQPVLQSFVFNAFYDYYKTPLPVEENKEMTYAYHNRTIKLIQSGNSIKIEFIYK